MKPAGADIQGRWVPEVLYEDNHLIVIHKPAGMPSQDDPSGDLSAFEWVKAYLKNKYQKAGNVYAALLHRLDRPVGGILVMAKTSKAAARMSKLFHDRELDKTYWAITEKIPVPAEGHLVHYLRKIQDRNIMQAFDKEGKDTQRAALSYRVLQTQGTRALVEVKLETGRRHQIRVQLTAIGCPIVGDVKYGKSEFLPDLSIALLAREIAFEHPVTRERMHFTAAPPRGYPWDLFTI